MKDTRKIAAWCVTTPEDAEMVGRKRAWWAIITFDDDTSWDCSYPTESLAESAIERMKRKHGEV